MTNSGKFYTIGQISHLSNLSVKTLRFYDQKGLLQPEIRDKENNYRYYSEKQLLQILVLKGLKSLGFSLDEIRNFNLKKDLFLLQQQLEAKKNELEANIANLKVQLQTTIDNYNKVIAGATLLNAYKNVNIDDYTYDIEVIEIPKCNYVSTRYRSNCIASELFLERFAEIMNIKDKHHLHSTEPLFAIFHDHYLAQFSSKDTQIDLEVCMPVLEEKNVSPEINIFGGFTGATTIHVGGYPKGISAYMALIEWIDNNDLEISGSAIEQYIVGPNHTDNEEDFVTRIIFPVQ